MAQTQIKKQLKIFFKYVKPYEKSLQLFAVMSIFGAVVSAFVPYVLGKFFDALYVFAVQQVDMSTVLKPLFVWALVLLLASFLGWLSRKLILKVEFKADTDFNTLGLSEIIKMPSSFHKEHKAGTIRHKISRAAARFGWLINVIFNQYLASFVRLLFGLFMAFVVSWKLALLLLMGEIVYAFLAYRFADGLQQKQKRGYEAWMRAYGESADILSNIFAVKAFAKEGGAKKTFQKFFGKAFVLHIQPYLVWENVRYLQDFIVLAVRVAIFAFALFLLKSGEISVGDIVAMNGYVSAAFGPVVGFVNRWGALQNALIALEEADKLINKKKEVYQPKKPSLPANFIPSVEFKDVWFRYDRKSNWVLRGVSFKANPGELVAFVGESGVGKSTTVELILAYAFASKGKVLVSGTNIRKLPLKYLREKIALVPQETALFNDTIFNNLRFAKPKATEKEIWLALEKAGLKEFVESLPKKLKTKVGERGVKLSVGQKQRISIARAFLKDAPILILDEPTSALDAKTEKYLQETFDELSRGRTTFVIAHRLATVKKADKILVFDKGKIVEEGAHNELIQKENGVYRKLYEYQKL